MHKIELREGLDFLKSLKTGSVDLILTDPPYQISKDTGMQKSRDKSTGLEKFRIRSQFGDWDTNFGTDELAPFIKESYRVLRKGGTMICFYDLWKVTKLASMYIQNRFKQLRFIEWVKTNPVPVNSKINYLTNSREIAITAVKGGKPTFNTSYHNGIYQYAIYQGKKGERIHVTQKSLPLFEQLIKTHTHPGDLVVDPFLGSGTTSIAAYNSGRSSHGAEIDSQFYLDCLGRVKQHHPGLHIKLQESQQSTEDTG